MTVVVINQIKSQLPLQRLFMIMWPHWLPRADRQIIVDYFKGHRWNREGKSNG